MRVEVMEKEREDERYRERERAGRDGVVRV